MKNVEVKNELEEKVLSWQQNDSLIRRFRENPKFSPGEIQSLIEELTLLRIESVELHETQVELEESRRRFEELYDLYPDGFLVIDETSVIKEANIAISRQLGQKTQDLIGRNFLLSCVAQDSQEAFNQFMIKLFQSRCKCSCELFLRDKSWQSLPVLLTGCIRKGPEGDLEVHIVISKIQKISEKRSNPLVIVDMEGKLRFVSSEFSKVTGYSQSELLNQSIADLLSEDDRCRVMTGLLKARMGIPVNSTMIFRVRCKNQNNLCFRTRPRPIILNGKPQGFAAVLFKGEIKTT